MTKIPGINAEIQNDEEGNVPRAAQVRSMLMQNAKIGLSMRYRRLDRLDAFAHCMEYQHLETDWNGYPADMVETISPNSALPPGYSQPMQQAAEDAVPLSKRRPSAPMRLTPTIIDRFTGMLFSEDRIPTIKVEGDPEADEFLNAAIEDGRFWKSIRQGRSHGGGMGTALITFKLTEGRYVFKAHNPKYVADYIWADKDRMVLAGVLIQYLTLKEFDLVDGSGRPTGKTEQFAYVYRRIIDEQWDITFKEALLDEDGRPPMNMEIDLAQSFEHNLERFPGVWVQNIHNGDDVDGIPDCDGAYQMMAEADRVRSQAIRGLKYNMDPTLVTARDFTKLKGSGPINEKGNGVAIELGPGGSAQYLEIAATGIQAAKDKVADIKKDIFTKTQCVIPDPESPAANASSGKALEIAFQPMLEKCGILREQWGDAIIHLCELILHAARVWNQKTMYVGNVRAVFTIPPKIEEKDPAPDDPDIKPKIEVTQRKPGVGGRVTLKWGSYFSSTPNDKQIGVTTVSAARMGKLIDDETAIRLACEELGLDDPEAVIRKIREQQKKIENEQVDMGGGILEDEEVLEEEALAAEDPALEEEELAEPPPNPPSGQPGGFQ